MNSSAKTKITVAGVITDPSFHRCVAVADKLEEDHYDTVTVERLSFFETQWEEYLKKTANKLKGVFYQHEASPLIYLNDSEYVGDSDKFHDYALHTYKFRDDTESKVYLDAAEYAYKKAINESKTRKYAFMDFNFQHQKHTIIFELFVDIAPKTCENFIQLCKGFKKPDGEEVSYSMSEIGRIVKGMFIQCGRIKVHKTPATGSSFYGHEFADESFAVKHQEVGMLGMCKRGGQKHTNESQFYITTGAPLSFMDGQNVVFGRVIEGMESLREIECVETLNEKPNEPIKISSAGLYKKI